MSEASRILPSSEYHIFSKASGFHVGRKPAEDKSLRPKGIYTNNPSTPISTWTIEHVGGGKYKLKNNKADVGDDDHLLWAFLTEEEQLQAGKWRIIEVPQMGQDCFIIVRPDQSRGWVADSNDPHQKQIKVRPLIVQPSYPPRYPTYEVFVIKRANA